MDYFYEWMQNLAVYMILVTIVIQMLPNNSYKKYVRFFTGLILIILLSGPILKILGIEQEFQTFYEQADYEQRVREIERATEFLEGFSGKTE